MGIKKQFNLTYLAFKNINVYKRRTISIIISIGLIIGMLSAIDFLREGINQDIDASLTFTPDILIEGYQDGRLVPLNQSQINAIAALPEVISVQPRVWGYLSAANKLYTLMGINVSSYPFDFNALDFELLDGRFLSPNESLPVCVIGSGVADASHAQVGSVLLLTDINGQKYELEVVGIFSVSSKIYSHDLILTDIKFSREFFDMKENYSTDCAVWINESVNVDRTTLVTKIAGSTDNIKVIDKTLLGDLLKHSTNERAGIFTLVWAVLLIGSLLFSFSISSAISAEARKEVGILKAIGYTTMDILEIKIIEFAITGFIATTVGLFGAIIFDFYLGAPVLSYFMLGWSVLFPPFILPLKVTFNTILVAYGLGIIPLLIAVVVPAWKHAITETAEVLREI